MEDLFPWITSPDWLAGLAVAAAIAVIRVAYIPRVWSSSGRPDWLDEPGAVRSGDELCDGEVQVIEGQLRIAGPACASFESGGDAAVSTAFLESDQVSYRRADGLALQLEGPEPDAVVLEGEVRAVVGSQHVYPDWMAAVPFATGKQLGHRADQLLSVRSLYRGDRVRVRGTVAQGALSSSEPIATPFRTPATKRFTVRALNDDEGDGAVEVAYLERPAIFRSSFKRWVSIPLFWIGGYFLLSAIMTVPRLGFDGLARTIARDAVGGRRR